MSRPISARERLRLARLGSMATSIRWLHRLVAVTAVCLFPGLGVAEDSTVENTTNEAAVTMATFESLTADQWRERGPEGLTELMTRHRELIDGLQSEDDAARVEAVDQLGRLEPFIAEVAAARDAHMSGLYWYTDMDAALAEAQRTRRPILSLRLMGQLTDEYSCANSRFFRTALYANETVATFLRDNYVMHWESVRPVPRVTIDFGDGRVMHRTLTGNSVHLILDSNGQPIDAIPGLYSPRLFLNHTHRGLELSRFTNELNADPSFVKMLHSDFLQSALLEWQTNLDAASVTLGTEREVGDAPDAVDALPVTVSKSVVEIRLAEDVVMKRLEELEGGTEIEAWREIANIAEGDVPILDENSRRLIASQVNCNCVWEVCTDDFDENLQKKIDRFESSIALDTVRNEYLLHTQIHMWLANAEEPMDAAALTEKIYDELFLTPSSDPWIGLLPDDVYTALVGEGVELESGIED